MRGEEGTDRLDSMKPGNAGGVGAQRLAKGMVNQRWEDGA